MDEVDRAIAVDKPDSWKGYTIGDPLFPSKQGSYWWLDDEKLMYPFYEKAVKSGDQDDLHPQGLLPADYEKSWPGVWEYATVRDVGKAAKDWRQLNFVMYRTPRSGRSSKSPGAVLAEFEQTGRIKWATDLADILASSGSATCTGEVVGTAFATCATSNPRFAAAFEHARARGLGADHVIWGSDSLWYGSPQWQIRRCAGWRFPTTCKRSTASPHWGRRTGAVKSAVFAGNSARIYNLQMRTALGAISTDRIAAIKAEYVAMGGLRSNTRYGYVDRGPGHPSSPGGASGRVARPPWRPRRPGALTAPHRGRPPWRLANRGRSPRAADTRSRDQGFHTAMHLPATKAQVSA